MERSSLFASLGVHEAALLGMDPDYTAAVLQGMNLDVDTGTAPEDLLPGGGLYDWPTALESMEVVSSSALDTAAGTGARTMTIVGLNLAFAPVSETVTLNGLTPVACVNQYYRINSFNVNAVGALSVNQGEVVLRRAGAGPRRFTTPALYGRGQTGIYTVPAGFIALTADILATQYEATGAANFSAFQFFSRLPGGSWFHRIFLSTSTATPNVVLQPRLTVPFTAGTDVLAKVNSVGASNTVCTSTVTFLLRRV